MENVCFEVTSGMLDREVMVAVWTVNGVARGEGNRQTHTDAHTDTFTIKAHNFVRCATIVFQL